MVFSKAPNSSSVHFNLVTQSCPTICNPVDGSTPGFPVHHQLPAFAQTHVHWVGNAIYTDYKIAKIVLRSSESKNKLLSFLDRHYFWERKKEHRGEGVPHKYGISKVWMLLKNDDIRDSEEMYITHNTLPKWRCIFIKYT